jgi:hypothetical protein
VVLDEEREEALHGAVEERMDVAIPDARLRVYPETGHLVHWERPERFIRDLEDFMRDVQSARRHSDKRFSATSRENSDSYRRSFMAFIDGRWRALTLLALTLVLSMSTWFSATAIIPQLRAQWELSGAAAWLTIAVQVGFVCGALLSSFLNLSDVVSPRHVILGGAAGAATANGLLVIAGSATLGIPLRFATEFFLVGVYPPAFKLISTWFTKGRGMALGTLAGALILGNAMPHLVNGLGGLDWRLVIYATSFLTLMGGLIAEFAVKEGPFPFPRATFDPRQAGRVFANRGVRLASFGYFGHM